MMKRVSMDVPRSRNRRTALRVGVGLLLVVLFAHTALAATGEALAGRAAGSLIGHQVPAMRMTDIDGHAIDLGQWLGHTPIYLKFWATWCGPCRAQMPHFEATRRAAGGTMAVLAINLGIDDTDAQIRAYRRELGLGMPIVRDDGRLAAAFDVRVTPQHVLIDRSGRIAYVGHELNAALATALEALMAGRSGPALDPPDPSPPMTPALPTALQPLEGPPVSLSGGSAPNGTWLVFTSTWCEGYFAESRPATAAGCRTLREALPAIAARPGVRVVLVVSSLWTERVDVYAYRDQHAISVPIVFDEHGVIFHAFRVDQFAEVVTLDAAGRIERRFNTIDPDAISQPSD
ncbi:MAG: TlpA family protein disulfide reductase [Gammaproteobacteria bacterium]|nr:TlpA family protein disulfide reductase [Gammaproteobacteria bacterium]